MVAVPRHDRQGDYASTGTILHEGFEACVSIILFRPGPGPRRHACSLVGRVTIDAFNFARAHAASRTTAPSCRGGATRPAHTPPGRACVRACVHDGYTWHGAVARAGGRTRTVPVHACIGSAARALPSASGQLLPCMHACSDARSLNCSYRCLHSARRAIQNFDWYGRWIEARFKRTKTSITPSVSSKISFFILRFFV